MLPAPFLFLSPLAIYVYNGLLILVQLAEADLASQARNTASMMGQGIQSGTAAAGSAFNRFVEGDAHHPGARGGARAQPEKKDFWDSFGTSQQQQQPEKKDFWDGFGAPEKGGRGGVMSEGKSDFWDEFEGVGGAEKRPGAAAGVKKPSGIGTSAVKKSSAGKKDDDWGEW